MKEMGVVRKVPIQWGGMHPVFEAVLLLKHTQSILSGMRKYFLMIIAYMTKRMIHPKKFKTYCKAARHVWGNRFVGSSHDGLS